MTAPRTSPGRPRRSSAHGFTLLEVMVALAIFALISLASYQLLDSLTRSRAALAVAADFRARLERAELVIEQDLRHLLPRSVRAPAGEGRLPALSSRDRGVLEFSRGGLPRNRTGTGDGVGRVIYEIETGDDGPLLYRVVYRHLDRLEDGEHYRQALLPGAAELRLRFAHSNGGWREDWPPEDRPGGDEAARLRELPSAVELVIALEDGREFLRLVSLR